MTVMKKEAAAVIFQERIARDIYSMWIETNGAQQAKPGQFVSMLSLIHI